MLLLALVLAAVPAEQFTKQFPGAATTAGPSARHLVHVSGFLTAPSARGPEQAARDFLSTTGASFGIGPGQSLVLRGAPAAGELGPVRFGREVDGLPVFNGDLVVGVDGKARVFLVNASEVGSVLAGSHLFGEAAAADAALAGLGAGVRTTGGARIEKGFRTAGGYLRAVYRVDFIASKPAGDWRVYVDGETGVTLFRQDRRDHASAPGNVYEVSPVETASSACPLSGSGGRTACAPAVSKTIANLSTGASLSGTQTSVYNCKGQNAPTSSANIPGGCSAVSASGSAFSFSPDTTYKSASDDFSAVMAYYHLDKHVSFFKSLDPSLPPAPGRAVRASLPALVNVLESGAAFENAYYSGGLDAMVFGQGATSDYAYDATVMYHEFTHGAVSAWGEFVYDVDSLGGLEEPNSVNEGTADAMAASVTGRSQIGSFISSNYSVAGTGQPPAPFLRDLADTSAARSCQGSGKAVSPLGATSVNGLTGEVHADGEIWNGFFWEVYAGLKAAGIKGCGGNCEAGPAIQYKALQLAGGTSPKFSTYWQTFKSAASALFPSKPAVPAYVDCVARRRGFDKCDRTVPLYAGERHVQYVRLRWGALQLKVTTTGAASLSVCSAFGKASKAYLRSGQPVQIQITNPQLDATVTADTSAPFTQECKTGNASVGIPSAGTWYVLLTSPSALTPNDEYFLVTAGATNVAGRPAASALPSCSLGGGPLGVSPASSSVAPKGQVAFAGTGGSGAGYVFGFSTNASGGTIDPATGAYVAGAVGSVTDGIKLTDSAGATASASVAVGPRISVTPQDVSVGPGALQTFTASGGTGSGYSWALAANPTGGTIDKNAGIYTAGLVAGTDVVQVSDPLGNTATTTVTVPSSGGCSTLSGATGLWALGLLGFGLWRRRAGARS